MDNEQRRLIDNLAMRTGININEVIELLDDVDYDLTVEVLEAVQQDDRHSKPMLFRQKAREARRKVARDRQSFESARAYDRRVAAWGELRETGFKATVEQLEAQINDLYEQRLLHDHIPTTLPPHFAELDYEQQEAVLLGLAMKGIKEMKTGFQSTFSMSNKATAVAVIDDIPF